MWLPQAVCCSLREEASHIYHFATTSAISYACRLGIGSEGPFLVALNNRTSGDVDVRLNASTLHPKAKMSSQ